MKKIGAVLLVACVIQGCSSGSPSQSEIETAVTSAFTSRQLQECDKIEIENIQKKNGIKVDDSTYQIIATFDVRVVPVGHKEEVDELRARQKSFEQERMRTFDEAQVVGKSEGVSYTNLMWLTGHPEETSEAMRPLVDKYVTLNEQAIETGRQLDEKVKAVRKEWGSDYCYMIVGSGVGTGQYGFKNSLDTIMEGGLNSFERTFNMVKTDNGWMELE